MGLLARVLLGRPRAPHEIADRSVDLPRWTVLHPDLAADVDTSVGVDAIVSVKANASDPGDDPRGLR